MYPYSMLFIGVLFFLLILWAVCGNGGCGCSEGFGGHSGHGGHGGMGHHSGHSGHGGMGHHSGHHGHGIPGSGGWRGNRGWWGWSDYVYPVWWYDPYYYLPSLEGLTPCARCAERYKMCVDGGGNKEQCVAALEKCVGDRCPYN